MIELVAITDDPAPPPEPLRTLRCRELNVLWAVPQPVSEPTAEDLWRHEELLERLLADRDLLPVRYGTLVKDEDAAARLIGERHDELLAALDRVRGAVEVAVRVVARGEAPERPPASSGREYLDERADDARAAQAVHAELAARARDSAVLGGDELLRAAYLVERERVDEFVHAVERLQAGRPDLALVCTGPWPPFSFTGGGSG